MRQCKLWNGCNPFENGLIAILHEDVKNIADIIFTPLWNVLEFWIG